MKSLKVALLAFGLLAALAIVFAARVARAGYQADYPVDICG